jgi:hypothetical protein
MTQRWITRPAIGLAALIASGAALFQGSGAHAWCRPSMHGCRHYPKVTIPSPECSGWKGNCRTPVRSYSNASKVTAPAFSGISSGRRR